MTASRRGIFGRYFKSYFSKSKPFNIGVVPRYIRRSYTESFVDTRALLWILIFLGISAEFSTSGDPQIQNLGEKKICRIKTH